MHLILALLAINWIGHYAEESAAAAKVCEVKDYTACRGHLMRLYELLDGRADIAYRLAKVEARLGNQKAAGEWLALYAKSGLTFADPAAEPAFEALRATSDFKAVLSRLESARQPISHSRLFASLPAADLVAEDIAYDPTGKRFYVSSVRHRKILWLDWDREAGDFVPEGQPGVWAILALGVDGPHRYLWASTVAMPEALGYTAADEGRSALLKYSLASGKLVRRYDLAGDGKHALGDMTISPDGDVFVSDGEGAVYWVDHRRDTLEVLVGNGTFKSPQTPALAPDGRRLFVADYSRGIGVVDLATKESKLLAHPKELSLAGIDGLYLAGRSMIAIQNGVAPERLIRMQLDDSLTRVVQWETMEANWVGLGDPTHGVMVGGKFYFIANSGWDQFADNGSLKAGGGFSEATIREMVFER